MRFVFIARIGCVLTIALGGRLATGAIDVETVFVSNVGNPSDSRFMNDGTTGYGDVGYEYRIGKYEVTNDQYAAFLNAIATNGDTYLNYEPFSMGGAHYGGIIQSGGAPNTVFTVKPNMGNKPVVGVTAGAARRFVNWLHNGQPTGNQVPGTTETGVYDLTGENWVSRGPEATWFLPSEDEWYKAAFYNPSGGGSGLYALYATGSLFTPPTVATADAIGNVSNPGVNVANYFQGANWNGSAPFGHVTTVGSAGLASASYYGTYDQSGNASEWTEDISVRGGGFGSLQDQLSAEVRFGNSFGAYAGFRVASALDTPNPNEDLLAYWNAENGAIDVTGNGHDGVFQGNAATVPGGPFGHAFTFDGAGDYINIGDELDMGASDFTLSAWIKGDPTMDQWGRILDKGYATAYSFHRRAATNEVGFEMFVSGNGYATTTPVIDNTWHHVALVKDGTTVTIYADGDAEGTNAVSGAAQNNALPLLIGFNPGEGVQGYWKGELDELKIFGRALSAAEVAALALDSNDFLAGDFDEDHNVDGDDLARWRANFGTGTTHTQGDADADGDADGADFLVWQRQVGGGGAIAAGGAVPEPTKLILAMIAMAACGAKKALAFAS